MCVKNFEGFLNQQLRCTGVCEILFMRIFCFMNHEAAAYICNRSFKIVPIFLIEMQS